MTEQAFSPVEWLTTREAAELTGYSMSNFQKAAKRGRLDSILRGHTRFFKRQDIVEYVHKMQELGKGKHSLSYKEEA